MQEFGLSEITPLICALTIKASLVAQRLKHLPAMRETWVQEDPLEKEMVTHSSILAWRIPWMEEPGGPQSTGSQRVRHDFTFTFTFNYLEPVFCFPPESPQGVQSGVVGVTDGLMVTASFVVWHGRQHSLSTLCPTWVIQNICPILKSITNSYLQSPFLPYKVTLTFWGFGPLGPSGALLQLITSRNILLLVSHRFKSSEHQLYDVEQNH